ncbi:MGMT family protein [Geomicrobium sediminis]|uniref:Methylated-DNA-protein-cysteine methyltransferase-like protein n=1 Tax=Geomicrobium sediminis TaxID=1347788 RepID=A0ABS2PBD4_9BACL|nr:MGMT family protein [Geomicrobium sediminis]MBM7632722.1 methylated-DNA-protein-cysteine methyltransferase-like protein [Geomicrobium sediminis]
MKSNFYERVYTVTAEIPEGKVATYGLIARWLGKPRGARAVGWALRDVPTDLLIPAHRVIYRDGSLAASEVFGGVGIQKERLIAEGVPFKDDDHVNMKAAVWEGPLHVVDE